MKTRTRALRNTLLAGAAALALLVAPMAAPAAASPQAAGHAGGRGFVAAVLTGSQEVGGGDTGGIGFGAAKLDRQTGQICYVLAVARLSGTVTLAHIHKAPRGSNGPIVVPLTAPVSGFVAACTTADPALVADIARHPNQYYFNVHTSVFPGGAIRGQLHR